jgi:FtsP/CotA-like multicopper oxidase with cupredoxin domain
MDLETIADCLLQLADPIGDLSRLVAVEVVGMGCGDHVRGTALKGQFGHRQTDIEGRSSIIQAVQDMAMNVNHGRMEVSCEAKYAPQLSVIKLGPSSLGRVTRLAGSFRTRSLSPEMGALVEPARMESSERLPVRAFVETNLKWSINGYIFGNMTMKEGDRVRWYVATVGDFNNGHTPHWHGNTVLVAGQRTDVLQLTSATRVTADMAPDAPGIWLYHSHISDPMLAGMVARYEVLPC